MVDIGYNNAAPALPDAFGVMAGSSIKSLGFSQKDQYGQSTPMPIGTSYTGTLADDPQTDHITDPVTREPLYWDAGKQQPKLQVILTLDTDYRDPENQEDDGKRRIFFKSGMLQALQAEMRAQKIQRFGLGTRVTVELINMQPTQYSPKKIFKVSLSGVTQWVPPQQRQVDGALASSQAAPQQAPVQGAQTEWAQQAPASATAQAPQTSAPQGQPAQQPVAQAPAAPVVAPAPEPAPQPAAPVQAAPAPAPAPAPVAAPAEITILQSHVDELNVLLQANVPGGDAVQAVAIRNGYQGNTEFTSKLAEYVAF